MNYETMLKNGDAGSIIPVLCCAVYQGFSVKKRPGTRPVILPSVSRFRSSSARPFPLAGQAPEVKSASGSVVTVESQAAMEAFYH